MGDLFSGMELMPFEIKQPSTCQQAMFGFRNISPSGLIYAIDIDLLKQLEEEESLFLSCVSLLYTINGVFSVHLTEETKPLIKFEQGINDVGLDLSNINLDSWADSIVDFDWI